ncbi:outer membrane efflux protein [Fimbriimonas ginsengisoli Gsoil 348]|uniref:Outer membrane efflux protein n=2 Tax=Fimbriimonas ginsengisoli TaxID=1005039 RepID=A0A068NS96_FIMGI|nr:outer membrane efflux protein [Fimbriimonas ginsengisoli Gsoil 348]
MAFRNRNSVRAAEFRVRQAIASRSALGAPLPTRLEFGAGSLPDVSGGEDLLLAQPLDIFGRSSAGRASGNAALAAARAALRQTKLDLQGEVLTAFAEAQSAQALVQTGQSIFDIADKVYAATKRRADQGDLPPAQLLRADLDRERARQTIEVRRRSLAAAVIRLAGSLGVAASSLDILDSAPVPLPTAATGIETRPDLQQLQSDVANARAEIRQGRLTGLPDVELQFRRSPWSTPEQYGARLQVVMPLWDWGASRNRVRAAQQGERAAKALLADRQAIAQSEIASAQADYDAATATLASFERLAADARTLLEKEQRGFDLGASTLLDVLDATRALRDIEEGVVNARLSLAQAATRLMTTTGTIVGETK